MNKVKVSPFVLTPLLRSSVKDVSIIIGLTLLVAAGHSLKAEIVQDLLRSLQEWKRHVPTWPLFLLWPDVVLIWHHIGVSMVHKWNN